MQLLVENIRAVLSRGLVTPRFYSKFKSDRAAARRKKAETANFVGMYQLKLAS